MFSGSTTQLELRNTAAAAHLNIDDTLPRPWCAMTIMIHGDALGGFDLLSSSLICV